MFWRRHRLCSGDGAGLLRREEGHKFIATCSIGNYYGQEHHSCFIEQIKFLETVPMRIEGNLAKWNDDRGFGFITPAQGGPEVFVHVSAFPKRGQRPSIGQRLTFEIETDSKGRKQATNLLYPDRSARPIVRPIRHEAASPPGFLRCALPIVAVAALAFYGYPQSVVAAPPANVVTEPAITQPAVIPPRAKVVAVPTKRVTAPQISIMAALTILLRTSSSFHCDGRTRCTQMTSCAEATYFINHCPGVKMDGDNDGIPCEDQWCNR